MNIKDDLRNVVKELSVILAGFKLAVIVIGWFGLGSVAKWVISYWYPFTRWVWDSFAELLSLPDFPIIIKDSLTALLFFLPLGLTAVLGMAHGKNSNDSLRVMAAVFGCLFLLIICKDVISSIYESLAVSVQTLASKGEASKINNLMLAVFISLYLLMAFILLGFLRKARKRSSDKNALLKSIKSGDQRMSQYIRKYRFKITLFMFAVTCIMLAGLTHRFIVRFGPELGPTIMGAMTILLIIITCIILATLYSPRKLYLTTGSAIAFVFAAIFFEAFIFVKQFMESVS